MMIVGLLAAGALVFLLWRIGDELQRYHRAVTVQQLLAMFAPALAAAQEDPRQLLVWYPIAQTSRKLFPGAFKDLDNAAGAPFPFTKEQVKAAHSRCTADWLAWERAHDAEYSLKTAQVQDEIDRAGGPASALLRTRLAAVEQQKLERYQQRYQEYIRTAKALAAFAE
jgi:hypothetical protein